MNYQEQQIMRTRMRELQSLVEKLSSRLAELEAKIAEFAPLKVVRQDKSRRAIL